MRLTYAGCNLFGQVPTSKELAIDRFQQLPTDAGDDKEFVDIALGHSITVYLKQDGVYFYGHGLHPKETHQVTKLNVTTDAQLKMVKTCDTSVFLLDEEGGLFVLDFLAKNPSFIRRVLKRNGGSRGTTDKLINFAPGTNINVGLTQSGLIYNFPDLVEFKLEDNVVIKKISAGYEHAAILDSDGCVYMFGNGRRGQLGNGALDIKVNPLRVEPFDGIFITDISCGGWHTMALSRDGDVYIWGWNSDGQLGLFDDVNEPLGLVTTPQYLPIPDDNINVSHIAAGGRHSIVITSDNKVYGFGCNKFNQLGIPDYEALVNKPTKVYNVPKQSKIVRVVCGPSSTAIITDDDKENL